MRKRIGRGRSASVLFMIVGAIFFMAKPELSYAQNEGFKLYELLVFCGDTSLTSAIFGHEVTEGGTIGRPLMGTKSICVGNCGSSGTVTLEDALAKFPPKVSEALRAKVDKHQADAADGKGSPLPCLGDAGAPPANSTASAAEPPANSTASAVETGDTYEVEIQCPPSAETVSINWKNHMEWYGRDFEIDGGSDAVRNIPLKEKSRDGQKLTCSYRTTCGPFIGARYTYKVKHEIISCFPIHFGFKCIVKK